MREVRTITTNKTDADIVQGDSFITDFNAALTKHMAISNKALMHSLMLDDFGKAGVEKKGDVQIMVDRVQIHKKTVSYSNGYWAKIEINETDHVTYKVFNSGWLAKVFSTAGFRKVTVNGWDSVKQRDTVEATLGATYMAIDEAIATDESATKHSTFLKEMIKTDPDNLKAIAQLDMLDKCDGPGTEDDRNPAVEPVLSAGSVSAPYAQNIKVAGSGAYFTKDDPTKPASFSVGPTALNAGGSHSISFSNGGEEAIKVDPDGGVSFGDKMAQAIKSVVDEPTEKGEVDE